MSARTMASAVGSNTEFHQGAAARCADRVRVARMTRKAK